MNEMTVKNQNLPDTMEDLAKFVLVGREKLNSVRAEIRAIDKLVLAQEVRDQKREEAAMISEAILDAEVKLGELFKLIPKATSKNNPSGQKKDTQFRTAAELGGAQTKMEIIKELGFSQDQSNRFEKLADNADLVEYVKAEARENGEIPTRAKVFDMAELLKNQHTQDDDFIDLRVKVYKDFTKILDLIANFEITKRKMDALRGNFDHLLTVEEHAEYINEAVNKLNLIKMEIYKRQSYEKR
jgi:hypothetical protein